MNIAVAQSGGPTCAINASLVGVFRESLKEPAIDAIFGSVNGVEGIIQDHLIDLKTFIDLHQMGRGKQTAGISGLSEDRSKKSTGTSLSVGSCHMDHTEFPLRISKSS